MDFNHALYSRRRSRAHFAIRRQWFGHWVDYLQYITVNYFQESHSGNAQPFFSQFELTFSSFLTLIGMREYTFHPLSFFGSDFDCWVKNFQPFWRWKLTSIGLVWHPARLIESYKTCSYVTLKMCIFLTLTAHANYLGSKSKNF